MQSQRIMLRDSRSCDKVNSPRESKIGNFLDNSIARIPLYFCGASHAWRSSHESWHATGGEIRPEQAAFVNALTSLTETVSGLAFSLNH